MKDVPVKSGTATAVRIFLRGPAVAILLALAAFALGTTASRISWVSADEADGHYTYAGSGCSLDGKDPQNVFFHWNNSTVSNVVESSKAHIPWPYNATMDQYFWDHGLCLATQAGISSCSQSQCSRYHMRFRQGWDNSELDGTPYTNAAAHWEDQVYCFPFTWTHRVPPTGFNEGRDIVYQRFTDWGHYTHWFYKGNTVQFSQNCGGMAGSDGTVASPHGHWG